MSYLHYLWLLAYNGAQHNCVLFFFVLNTLCCQVLWIVHFFIASSMFSKIYLN